MELNINQDTKNDISKLLIKTSYVSPLNIQSTVENHYLPIFIVRNISNSNLIGKYSNTAVHCKELSPSHELFSLWKNQEIDSSMYQKKFMIELLNNVDFDQVFWKLSQLAKISNAAGIVLFGYGRDYDNCHRKSLSNLINNMGVLQNPVKELIF